MEEPIFMLLAVALSIVFLICFFVLCANVAKLVKLANEKENDYEEYLICLKMGEKDKAHYHLKRSMAKDVLAGFGQSVVDDYREKFEALGFEVPDMNSKTPIKINQ